MDIKDVQLPELKVASKMTFCGLLLFSTALTLLVDLDSYNQPMRKLFEASSNILGLNMGFLVDNSYLLIIFILLSLVVGTVQMILDMRHGAYLMLLSISFLTIVKDLPLWQASGQDRQVANLFFMKDLAIMGAI